MVPGPPRPADAQAAAAEPRPRSQSARYADRAAINQASSLTRAALTFALRCHAGQRRQSDGAPFIAHPLEVARLLREAGCTDVVVAAGLLHDVVENTRVRVPELTAYFGEDVATLVRAVTDDPSIQNYRQRKRMLRDQVRGAGTDAALLFAADKIAKVRELPDVVRADRARSDPRADRARRHLEHNHQTRLEHYHKSLDMLRLIAPEHPLVKRLASELDSYPVARQRRRDPARREDR